MEEEDNNEEEDNKEKTFENEYLSSNNKEKVVYEEDEYKNLINKINNILKEFHNLISNELMRPDCYMILKNGHITNFADKTNKTIRQAHMSKQW